MKQGVQRSKVEVVLVENTGIGGGLPVYKSKQTTERWNEKLVEVR